MEIVKVIWVINFFFFSLVIFFVWSKIYIISRRIKKAAAILEEIEKVTSMPLQESDIAAEPEKA